MTEREVNDAADHLLRLHGQNSVPVDVRAIAERHMTIEEGDFGPDFTGQLEFDPDDQTFAMCIPQTRSGSHSPRIRFTIAHELAHFNIPSHKARLLRGEQFQTQSALQSTKTVEREADIFAAALLIPSWELQKRVGQHGGKLDLCQVSQLAKDCQVSIEVAAFRFSRFTKLRHISIISKDSLVQYWFASDQAGNLRFAIEKGNPLPGRSATSRALMRKGENVSHGTNAGELWFSGNDVPDRVSEEAKWLGGGRVLTMLSWGD